MIHDRSAESGSGLLQTNLDAAVKPRHDGLCNHPIQVTWRNLPALRPRTESARQNFAQRREHYIQVRERLARHSNAPSSSGNLPMAEVFWRRERRKGKADFAAMPGAVHASTRPDFAPGKSGMGTSMCPSGSMQNPTPCHRRPEARSQVIHRIFWASRAPREQGGISRNGANSTDKYVSVLRDIPTRPAVRDICL